jgi:branched-chain amino acid transport system substrate-binding protein
MGVKATLSRRASLPTYTASVKRPRKGALGHAVVTRSYRSAFWLPVALIASLILAACSSSGGSGASSSTTSGTSATSGTVNIGLVGSLSGELAPNDVPIKQGVQAWVAYINAHGGLAGRHVVLYTADDGGSPTTFDELSQQMVKSDHVVAFVGDAGAGTVQGGASYLQSVGVPVIGGANENTVYDTNPDFYDLYTNLESANADTLGAVAKFVPSDKKMGVIYCAGIEACTSIPATWQQIVPKYGQTLAYAASAPLTTVDFTTNCLAAKNAGVQALGMYEPLQAEIALGKDCATENYHPTLVGDTSAVSPALVTQGGSYVNGLLDISQALPPWTPGSTLAPLRSYLHQTPVQVNSQAVIGWTAGKTLEAAGQYFPKTGTITSSDVVAGLHKLGGSTLGGLVPPLMIGQPGKPNPGSTCYFAVEIENGHWVTLNGGNYVC